MEQNAPQNETKPSIKLLNGTTLECYPRTGEAPRRTYGPVLESPTFFAKNAYYLVIPQKVIAYGRFQDWYGTDAVLRIWTSTSNQISTILSRF